MHHKKITNSAARLIFASLTLLGLLLSLSSGSALAVHDLGLFQLDYVTSPTPQGAANVSHTNITPAGNTGDDWDNVYKSVTGLGPGVPSSAFANVFIPDPVQAADHSFFTGGGSKDVNDVTQWQYGVGNNTTPNKNDLNDIFAAAYKPTTGSHAGHTLFYFGADRFDNSGDSQIGFWFFRSSVSLGPNGTFTGQHSVGDILVVADMVNGGQVGDATVYQWIGGPNPLSQLLDQTQADCSVAGADDTVCAVVNNIDGETPPWPYMNDLGQTSYSGSGSPNSNGIGLLFEGGLDVNALLNVPDIGCFSSFLGETRSSHEPNAQLKDFALGNFAVCGIKVTKTGDTLSKVGDPVDYTITIENTGSATLYKREISDTLLGAITTDGVDDANPYVQTNTCGASLAAGATCTITLQRTVQAGDPDPLPNTVSIVYSEHNDFTGAQFTSSDDHSVNLFQPAVMIAKTGDGLSKVGDSVTYTFTITNKSSQDSPNLTLASISDNVIGDLSAQATAAGCDTLTYQEVCSFSVTRTTQAGDADPLVNTVDVLYHPVGFPNNITASDGHSVNLFQPSVSIEKTGNALSKIGDSVTYHFKITNTSSSDSPALKLDSINDDVLGDLSSYASAASCNTLAPAAFCEFDVPWTVAAVDINPVDGKADDPVINTVTIHFHPDGFPNDITATGSHELNLFQPSIAFSKTADTELSKATDTVNYKLTLNNTSSPDTPNLVCTITDAKLGVNKQVTLASGTGDETDVAYTVQANDPDPLVNNASVSCSPTGFPNVLTASDSWTVNLFQPSITVDKTGPAFSKATDTATYNVTITNTSSADSPDLTKVSISDSLVPNIVPPASCDNLAPGASCTFSYDYVVQAGDPDPLVNTVTVHYNPVGFPNDITASGSATVDLLHPSFTVTKVCKANSEPIPQAGPAVFTITFNNTGDADMHVVPSEGAAFDVAAGQSYSYDYSIAGPFSATVNNTVTGTVTLAGKYGLSNSYTFSASGSCIVAGKAKVVKTVNGQPPAAGQTFTFELRVGASTVSDGTVLETKTTDANGNISFTTSLVPGQTYQLCEQVFPGWNTNLAGDGPLFVPNSLIPPSLPNPNVNNLTVCVNFTVTSGQTRTFNVDNTPPPGGRALTIGFWKNWASCASSNGKQAPILDLALGIASATTTNPPGGLVVSAQNAGSGWPNYAPLWYLVLKGDPTSTQDNIKPAPDCSKAVNLLNKSTMTTGKKMASDPLFNMTAQLIAAQLNRFMGAGINGATITNIDKAVLLDGKYGFNGNTYSPKLTAADASKANCLATQLDNYNNNLPTSACP